MEDVFPGWVRFEAQGQGPLNWPNSRIKPWGVPLAPLAIDGSFFQSPGSPEHAPLDNRSRFGNIKVSGHVAE
jgi:hypothetical protein